MESCARDVFHANTSPSSAADASTSAQLSWRVDTMSDASSSLATPDKSTPLGDAAKPSSRPQPPPPCKQEPHEQQQRASSRTPFTSLVLSLRGNSPSFVASRPTSPPRVRPTSELPPTRDAMSALRCGPTAVKSENNILHDSPAHSMQPLDQPQTSAALRTFSASQRKDKGTTVDLKAAAEASSSSVGVPQEERPLRTNVSRVCSLCGMSILMMGTFVEHQRQWKEHLNSWVHQRNLQLRADANQNDFIPIVNANVAYSSPISPRILRVLEDISASPVLVEPEYPSPEATLPVHVAHMHPQSGRMRADKYTTSSMEARKDTAATTATAAVLRGAAPTNVFKKLSYDGNHTTSTSGEEGKGHGDNHSTPGGAAGVRERRRRMTSREKCHNQQPLSSSESSEQASRAACGKVKTLSQETETNKKNNVASFLDDSDHISMARKADGKRKQQLERTFTSFLVKKERWKLLLCFRRWFNLMFTRRLNDHSFPNRVAPEHASTSAPPSPAAAVASAPVTTIPTADFGGKRLDVKEVLPTNQVAAPAPVVVGVLEKKEDAYDNDWIFSSPSHISDNKEQTNRSWKKTAIIDNKHREGPFMASQVKDFGHFARSSSSSSIEIEIAKTDVNWHIHHSERCLFQGLREQSEGSSSQTCLLENDRNIQELLSSLTPSLQERVRAVLRGEPKRSQVFPKTSRALDIMRCSLLATEPPSRCCLTPVADDRSHKSPSSPSPVAHPTRSESEMVGERARDPGTITPISAPPLHEEANTQYYTENMKPPELNAIHSLNADAGVGVVDTQRGHVTTDVDYQNLPSAPCLSEKTKMPGSQQEEKEPLGRVSGYTASADMRDGSLPGRSGVLFGRHQDPLPEVQPLISPPHRGRDSIVPNMRKTSDLFLHGSRRSSHPSVTRGRRGGRRGSSAASRGQRDDVDACSAQGVPKEGFRGIPGQYYCYYDGLYHRVLDPTSEVYFDARGNRLPFFVVHRPTSPSPSRRRFTPTTRAQSPLGPGRLNPYCAVCVEHYFLVLVDEFMEPLTNSPTRQRNGASGNTSPSHRCTCTRTSTTSPPPRRVRNPLLPRGERLPPQRISSRERQGDCFSSPSLRHCSPTMKSVSHEVRSDIHTSDVEPHTVSSAPRGGPNPSESQKEDHCSSEDRKWLRRQMRALRRQVKSLLQGELPQCRGSTQWVDYITSLNETMQTLEALRSAGKRPIDQS